MEGDEKRDENRKLPDVPCLEGTDGSTDLSFVKARVGTRDVREYAETSIGFITFAIAIHIQTHWFYIVCHRNEQKRIGFTPLAIAIVNNSLVL